MSPAPGGSGGFNGTNFASSAGSLQKPGETQPAPSSSSESSEEEEEAVSQVRYLNRLGSSQVLQLAPN